MNCWIILLLLFCCGGQNGNCGDNAGSCGGRNNNCGTSREREGRQERNSSGDCLDQRDARDDRRDNRRSEDSRRADSDGCGCDSQGMRMAPWQDFPNNYGRGETCGCEENK